MTAQPSLCRTWSETPKTGFLTTRHILFSIQVKVEVESDPEIADQSSENYTSEDRTSNSNSGPDRNSTQNAMSVDGLDGFPSHNEQYECQICKELFFSEWLYAAHMQTHIDMKQNGDQTSPKQKMRTHICTQCFMSFRRKSHLDQHLQTHTDVKEYECKMCERQYKRKGELMRHLKTHTGMFYMFRKVL